MMRDNVAACIAAAAGAGAGTGAMTKIKTLKARDSSEPIRFDLLQFYILRLGG